MADKQNYVTQLDMASTVAKHQVFDVFVYVAKTYPDLASALFDKYVNFVLKNKPMVLRVAEDRRASFAKRVASENIGYFIGNCDDFETRKFLFKTYPMAYHPVLEREF